jgi:hypothetical protein
MSKLNLANLAQHEVTKDETQRAKGGVVCSCFCNCECPINLMFEIRFQDKNEELNSVNVY